MREIVVFVIAMMQYFRTPKVKIVIKENKIINRIVFNHIFFKNKRRTNLNQDCSSSVDFEIEDEPFRGLCQQRTIPYCRERQKVLMFTRNLRDHQRLRYSALSWATPMLAPKLDSSVVCQLFFSTCPALPLSNALLTVVLLGRKVPERLQRSWDFIF